MRNKYARVKDNKVLIQNLLKKKFNTKRIHTGPKQNSSNSMHNIIEREREREREKSVFDSFSASYIVQSSRSKEESGGRWGLLKIK